MEKVKIGIVGCGNISQIYINNIKNFFDNMEAYALCDINLDYAKARGEEFGIERVYTLEEMMADENVQIILNITTPKSHYSINKAALEAGKNVYCEKPLTITYEEAKDLKALALEKGLFVGAAPDTFLGAGFQTAKALVEMGLIGKPVSAFTFDVCHGHEDWHPSPKFFYEEGAGPLFDRGPYNLSTMINILGPVDSVVSVTSKAYEERTILNGPRYGEKFTVDVPTHVSGVLTFKNGTVCTMAHSFDIYDSQLPKMEIHGTLGSLMLPDPNSFGGPIFFRSNSSGETREVPLLFHYEDNCRGLGLSDMANCVLGKKDKMRANLDMAVHLVEVMESLHTSSDERRFITMESTCEIPEKMDVSLPIGTV